MRKGLILELMVYGPGKMLQAALKRLIYGGEIKGAGVLVLVSVYNKY